ncbi:AprI/Inh family metalloprotease inhibitor [Methylorubrum sp. SB2]|uniref:AprI/Inh family metalloprotease inhibitor n=1 Tax=Methylorubrum subtropicum TaxID=3138812 RepID=UPI00313DD8B1
MPPRPATLALAVLLPLAAAAQEATTPPQSSMPATLPDTVAGAAGSWDLAIAGGQRRCVLTLSADSGPAGRIVRFPAGCRRALPVMAGIAGWLYADDGIRLVDTNVRPILSFAREPDGRSLGATAGNGERYSLVPLQIAAMRPASDTPPAPEPAAAPQPTAAPAPPPEGPAPGLYALDRATQKDVCRLELAPPDAAAKEAPVRLLPGCRDSGITVFDPATWRFASGLLTLKARRGHAVNLIALPDGRWRRDPDVGVTFVLRKVEP